MSAPKPTLEQRRAKHALEMVQSLDDKTAGKYKSYADGLPASIVMNGLGQAAATLLAQARGVQNDPHYFLYQHLESWLCTSDEPTAPFSDQTSLIEAITNTDQSTYVHAQSEALAYMVWLKKFAQAFLSDDENKQEEA